MTDFFLRNTETRDVAFDVRPEPAAPDFVPPAPAPENVMAAPKVLSPMDRDPAPAPAPAPATLAPYTPASNSAGQVYTADRSAENASVSGSAPLGALVELAAHAQTAGPLTIGLLGAAGAGKTTALDHVCASLTSLSEAAGRAAASPYVSRLVTVRVDASRIEGDPASALADEIHHALSVGNAGQSYAALATEAAHAVRDPGVVARELGERLGEARMRLDVERRALQELDGRRAKLVETILYDTPGSRVDGYARSNRGRLEARLRTFGFTGDPVANYKDLVRDLAERPGTAGRAGAFLHALWGFKGQTRLIVFAVLLWIVAIVLGLTQSNGPSWLGWLDTNGGERVAPMTAWLGSHLDWLGALRQVAIVGALFCLALNVWRAFRFTLPILRGVTLLRQDQEARSRDLSGLVAAQTRRVETMSGETDALARQTDVAERRAMASGSKSVVRAQTPFSNAMQESGARIAEDFTRALDQAMAPGGSSNVAAPQRIVVAIDGLDDLAPARRHAVVDAAQRLLSGTRFITLLAADPALLQAAGVNLDKTIQIPIRIAGTDNEPATWVRSVLGRADRTVAPAPDATRSALDAQLSADEAELLAEMAPFAGQSPRAVKRFVNLYRLARGSSDHPPALALMLAILSGGTAGERDGLRQALDANTAQLVVPAYETRLAKALAVAETRGGPLAIDKARAAYRLAEGLSVPA